jgi:pilus assembly protein CpaB
MKKVILIALIAAIAAGALLYFYLDDLEKESVVEVVYEDVLVASADIPAYSVITADMVTLTQMPEGTAHPRAAHSASEAIGFVTEGLIVAGEEILPEKLKQPGQSESGMSYIIPDGMRAVTISVDEISGVAGFVQRGDYVDVIAYTTTSYDPEPVPDSETGEITEKTQATTVVAAQNVCVAAVGTTLKTGVSTTDAEEEVYSSITLFLTPADAMRVIQSAKSGVITVVLRASGDHEANAEEPVVSDSLLDEAG